MSHYKQFNWFMDKEAKISLKNADKALVELDSIAALVEKRVIQMEKRHGKLITQALEIRDEEAKSAGTLAYLARILVLATMPHSKPRELVFQRRNGKFRLRMVADPDFGLPYGSWPRLILAWVSTRAVKTKSPLVTLGPSLCSFMHELGINTVGGQRGTLRAFKAQVQRLFTTSVTFSFDDEENGHWSHTRYPIALAGPFMVGACCERSAHRPCFCGASFRPLL